MKKGVAAIWPLDNKNGLDNGCPSRFVIAK